MERDFKKNNDIMTDIVVRMRKDYEFFSLIERLYSLEEDQIRGISQMLGTFLK